MGDHDHVPHDPPLMSPRIRVRVVEGEQVATATPTTRPDGKPVLTPAPPMPPSTSSTRATGT